MPAKPLVFAAGLVGSLLALPTAEASNPCPSDAFMDVSDSPGAGEGYPRPRLEVHCDGDELVVSSNAIPHYEFVQITPNPLVELNRDYRMPLNPKLAEQPSPLPLLGPSGVAINGIPLFGPNEGPVPPPGFGDPVYNAIMDSCMGHTARQYHYHALVETCFNIAREAHEPSPILAFGWDGFPVYGPFGCRDQECSEIIEYKSSWERLRAPRIDAWDAYRFVPKDGIEYLDRCNGHSGDDQGGAYHYHSTATWPYIMGCFSGTPSADAGRESDRQISRRDGGRGRPPGDDPRPTVEQVARAAAELAIDEAKLTEALRLTDGRVAPMNYAAAARALGIDARDLYRALGVTAQLPPPGARGGPGGRRRGIGPPLRGTGPRRARPPPEGQRPRR